MSEKLNVSFSAFCKVNKFDTSDVANAGQLI